MGIHAPPTPLPVICMCVCVYVSTPLHQPSVGQRSRCPGQKRYPCICLVCLYAWVAEGVRNWRCPPFCNGTLDKTKTTHFSGPLPHLVFKNKSGLWLQGHDNTSSLLSVVRLVALEESGEEVGKGVGSVSLHSRQPMPFECKASAAANPPLVPPSATATAATLLLFRRISQLFLDGRAKPSKDLHWRYVIKTRPPPRAAINIKIKELYADKWAANE